MRYAVLLVVALLACDEHGKSPSPFPCGAAMCSGNQLCRQDVLGIDAGTGIPPVCVTVAPTCVVANCTDGTCPPCILIACACSSCSVTLNDRELVCSGG